MLDEAALSRLVRIAPNFGSSDPTIRAAAAEAAHRIVAGAGVCWLRPSPLQAEAIHWRHGLRLAIDSEVPANDFEQQFLNLSRNRHGTPTAKQPATLENIVSRLVRGPIRLRL